MNKLNHKHAVIVFLLLKMSALPVFAAEATVDGGTINITGSVVDAACAVSTDTEDQTISLGQYRLADLNTSGAETTAVPFTIKLTDCDTSTYTNASVTFSGSTENSTTLALNGGSDSATNIGVYIMQNGTKLTLDGSTASTATTLTSGTNTFNFSAGYTAIATGATSGTANTSVTFKITYS